MLPLFILLSASVMFNFALYKNIEQIKSQNRLNNKKARLQTCLLMAIAVVLASRIP